MSEQKNEDEADFTHGLLALGRSISILHRFSQKLIDYEFREYNINKAQLEILIILAKSSKFLNQTEINNYFGYNKATITKLINGLEKAGFVERIQKDRDRREKILSLTEKGRKFQPLIIRTLNKEEEILGKLLSAEDEEFLRKRLYYLAESLKDYDCTAGLSKIEI